MLIGSKDTIDNILLSLLSSFIAYIIAMLFHARFPNLAAFFFWKPFSRKMDIVVSEVKIPFEPQMRSGQHPYLLPLGEVVAIGELLHFFRSQCKTDPPIVSARDEVDFDNIKANNLLILGGSKYNNAARLILQEISEELYYIPMRALQSEVVRSNDPELKVFMGKNNDYPNFTYTFQKDVQYATIIFRKDLYVVGKSVLVVAGLSSVSSLAGVNWVLSRPFSFWQRARKQRKGFQAIIKCRVIGQAQPSKIELVFYKDLI